jgi:hypothetical protein
MRKAATAMPYLAKQISDILGRRLLDNPIKTDKNSKVTPPSPSPHQGGRGMENEIFYKLGRLIH